MLSFNFLSKRVSTSTQKQPTISYETDPPTTTTEISTTSLSTASPVLTKRPPYQPVEPHTTEPTEETYEGSGSGDHSYYKGDGSNVNIDQELDSDDEDYDYREYKEGSGDGTQDNKYESVDGNDTGATGNVSSLSQEEMEQIR